MSRVLLVPPTGIHIQPCVVLMNSYLRLTITSLSAVCTWILQYGPLFGKLTNVVQHIGGTAGLIVAARLTENPDVKVGVIEAGANHMDDKQICTPCLYPTLIGREKYDWCMTSVPR